VTDILALDIATTCGWARGHVGETPTSGSFCFGRDCSENAVFAKAIGWFSNFLAPLPRPDILVIEAMLPGGAMRGETTIGTRDRLAGLHAIVRGIAHIRGIYDISVADVGTVRQHFIGARNLRSEIAKREVLEKCRMLGWPVTDHNAGDALATWHFTCSLIKPELALQTSPLFRQRAAE
jgi:hypothetical protein